MKYNESFLHGSIAKALVRFAIPLMLASFLQLLYTMTDLFVVGRFAETADVSAVSTSGDIVHAVTTMIIGFTTAVTILIGQFAGAKRPDSIARVVGTSAVFFVGLSAVLTVAMLLLNANMVDWLNTPAEAVPQAREYLRICSWGIVFITGYNVSGSIMRGMGNSKTPLLFVAVACVINIVADILLVAVFGMGAAGAAFATVFSQAGSFVFSLIYFRTKGLGFPFSIRDIRWEGEHAKSLLLIGIPLALQEFLVSISFVLITKVVNSLGLAASAASGIVVKVGSFFSRPTNAFSGAVSAMAAHNIGAGNRARAKKCMLIAAAICAAFAVIVNIFTMTKGAFFIRIFSGDPEVIEKGADFLMTQALDIIVISFVFTMNGYFNACGRSVFTMTHSLITTFCVRVPLAFWFGTFPEHTMRWLGTAAPITSVASVILCIFYIRYLDRHPEKILSVAK